MPDLTTRTTSNSHKATPQAGGRSNALAAVSLAVALTGVGLAAWGLLRPPSETLAVTAPTSAGPPPPSAQQIADARTHSCDAYNTVKNAVSLQTHADPGGDSAAAQGIAANARLAMFGGASYLLARTDPATPPELADAVHAFADNLQTISINALAGVGNDDPGQAARLNDAETAGNRVAELCQ